MSIDWAVEKRTARGRVLFALRDLEWHGHIELSDPTVGGPRFPARLLELRRLGYQMASRPINGNKANGKEYRLLSLKLGDSQGKKVKIYLRENDVERMLADGVISRPARRALKDALGSFKTNKHKL